MSCHACFTKQCQPGCQCNCHDYEAAVEGGELTKVAARPQEQASPQVGQTRYFNGNGVEEFPVFEPLKLTPVNSPVEEKGAGNAPQSTAPMQASQPPEAQGDAMREAEHDLKLLFQLFDSHCENIGEHLEDDDLKLYEDIQARAKLRSLAGAATTTSTQGLCNCGWTYDKDGQHAIGCPLRAVAPPREEVRALVAKWRDEAKSMPNAHGVIINRKANELEAAFAATQMLRVQPDVPAQKEQP